MDIKEITVYELKEQLSNEDCVLLDVREPWELELAKISAAINIPMHQVPDRLEEIAKDKQIFVLCHHGGRSMQVTQFLARQGYERLANVSGGIHSWSTHIDQNIDTY